MLIGLLADTHVPTRLHRLPESILRQLSSVDAILHAGDLESAAVLESLETITETFAVCGNCDYYEVARKLPKTLVCEFAGVTVGLIHGDRPVEQESGYRGRAVGYDAPVMEPFYAYLVEQFPSADVIVFGHLHSPVVKEWSGKLLVNPGPVVPRGGRSHYGLLSITPLGFTVDAKSVLL